MLGLHPLCAAPSAAAFNEPSPGAILVGQGSYVLTGKAVALRVARAVIAAGGSYVLTGKDISFVLSISQAGLIRILLVGSSATPAFGFKMSSNFRMVAGDTKTLVITNKDAEGTAVNITNSTVKWRAARSYGKAAVISKATGGSGITLTDPANGVFTVALLPADTEDLVGNLFHEAEITAADGTISTVLRGTMKIDRALIVAT